MPKFGSISQTSSFAPDKRFCTGFPVLSAWTCLEELTASSLLISHAALQ